MKMKTVKESMAKVVAEVWSSLAALPGSASPLPRHLQENQEEVMIYLLQGLVVFSRCGRRLNI